MINIKFAIGKFISRHKLLFSSLVIVWITGTIFTVYLISRNSQTKLKVQRLTQPLIQSQDGTPLPPVSNYKMIEAMNYCNPPQDIKQGEEGKSPVNGSLEFVAVMFRHGDRAPLRPIRNQTIINCGTTSGPLMKKYLKTLKYLRGSAKHLAPFTTFPLHPAFKQCTAAQMTLVGAHQHLMVGQALRQSYIEGHSLLAKNWTSKDIKVYSTVFSRTFQSAVAFLFGFLPTFNISNIKITPTPDDRFCMTEYYCNCHLAYQLEYLTLQKKGELLISHPAVLELMVQLNPIVKYQPNQSSIQDPFHMFDSLMGYVCHGSPLPCMPGTNECAKLEQLQNLITYLNWIQGQLLTDSANKKAAVVRSHGFLNHLIHGIKNRISGKDSTRFVLYSAHDVTLEPLLTVLGIHNGGKHTIPYASRIVFEVYSLKLDNELKYVIKILYKGKDVTKDTSFCKPYFKKTPEKLHLPDNYGLCPLESFQKFIEGLVLSIGFSSFQAACDSMHVT